MKTTLPFTRGSQGDYRPRLRTRCIAAAWLALVAWLAPIGAHAELRVGDICRIDGQQTTTIQGVGLVTGLQGTGDKEEVTTTRALAQLLLKARVPISQVEQGIASYQEIDDIRNVALVIVTAEIPSTGAHRGDKIRCRVQALYGKSLEGGHLLPTPLVQNPTDRVATATASGMVTFDDPELTTAGVIHLGCQITQNIQRHFYDNDLLTLVIDRQHASFSTADDIQQRINQELGVSTSIPYARALDATRVEVRIPEQYRGYPVEFAARVQGIKLIGKQTDAQVVIDERNGVIVIGRDVEIAPVAVTHKNLTIDAQGNGASRFVPLVVDSQDSNTKLQSLVDAMNAVRVPTRDIIEIIKVIEEGGNLYGRVIIKN